MKINMIMIFSFLSLIYSIICDLPVFKVTGVYHMASMCDHDKGYFQFVILGECSGFTEPIRITLPLREPETYKAVCLVYENSMNCTLDALMYDLKGRKRLKVFEETPEFDNLIIVGWNVTFTSDHTTLNDATNCESKERTIDPEKEDEEYIFAAYDAKNLDILGCFRNKNNFSFRLTKIKNEKNEIESNSDDSYDKDIYFEIKLKKPEDINAFCVMPKNNINNIYTVRCAIEYGGEIEIGDETSGNVVLGEKKVKIVLRGLLIPPTIVDECENNA